MDKLASLLTYFSMSAGVFYSGNICGIHDFAQDKLRGHIHLINSGAVQVIGVQILALEITEPTLLFLPRPDRHRLVTDDLAGANVVCATVQFGGGGGNPITDSLPPVVLVKLSELSGVDSLLALMFDEAFSDQSGRQAILDRLCEVLMIRLLRHCIEKGLTQGGTLAGLADPRLAKVLTAMQDQPAFEWSLKNMADLAGMSRARFAVNFRLVTGETPADYLASWRIMTAQRLLKRGQPLKTVAGNVGYASASALARAFARKLGCTPTEWMNQQRHSSDLPEPAQQAMKHSLESV